MSILKKIYDSDILFMWVVASVAGGIGFTALYFLLQTLKNWALA